jgi:hypothetical protein
MSTNILERLLVPFLLQLVFYFINHDNFGVDSLDIAPRELKYDPSIAAGYNFGSSLNISTVEFTRRVNLLYFLADVSGS